MEPQCVKDVLVIMKLVLMKLLQLNVAESESFPQTVHALLNIMKTQIVSVNNVITLVQNVKDHLIIAQYVLE